MTKLIVGLIHEKKVFNDVIIHTVDEVTYSDVDGITYEFHTQNETCTDNEMCMVIWFGNSDNRATFPISTIAYVKTLGFDDNGMYQ
jgi:hypothetical protein